MHGKNFVCQLNQGKSVRPPKMNPVPTTVALSVCAVAFKFSYSDNRSYWTRTETGFGCHLSDFFLCAPSHLSSGFLQPTLAFLHQGQFPFSWLNSSCNQELWVTQKEKKKDQKTAPEQSEQKKQEGVGKLRWKLKQRKILKKNKVKYSPESTMNILIG